MCKVNYAKIETVTSWDKARELSESFKETKFLFRGQSQLDWELKTSLERFLELFHQNDKDKYDENARRGLENYLLEEFQRRYHHYSAKEPEIDKSPIEWWALMQHYGVPTRLLDWTYSFYAALFFALEDLDNDVDKRNVEKEAAVWVIDHEWLLNKFIKKNKKNRLKKAISKDQHFEKKETFKLFDGTDNILRISPFSLNTRQSVQQGCFLIPGRIPTGKIENTVEETKGSFIKTLIDFAGSEKELKENFTKIHIKIDKAQHRKILAQLYRMNISRATLFPGLEGFSASLKTSAYAFPELIKKNKI